MLRKLDAALIDRLDRLTTKLQRRGVLLTGIHLVAAETSLVLTIAQRLTSSSGVSPFGLIFDGIVWGGWAVAYRRWASQNKDYPESKRIMEQLNAKAVYYREYELYLRLIWVWLVGLITIISGIDLFVDLTIKNAVHQVLSILACLSPAIMWYLNPCIFLGPGHFAKDRKESFISDPITLRG